MKEKDTKTAPGSYNGTATTKLIAKADGRLLLEVAKANVPRGELFRAWNEKVYSAAAEFAAIARLTGAPSEFIGRKVFEVRSKGGPR